MARPRPLSIRLLGEIEVLRGGERVSLPRSKKTRALLAYLVMTRRAHRRDRLCALLWDVTDDPRAALRWSLSKLRSLLDDTEVSRLVTDRDAVAFEPAGADVDVLELRRVVEGDLGTEPVARLRALLERFRGPFAEGLELTDFSEFHAWCVAERARWHAAHRRVLSELVDRLEADAGEAAVPARELVRLDPDNEAVRARLVRLLYAAGRRDEAEEHYRLGLAEIERSGARPTGELRSTWRSVTAPALAVAPVDERPPASTRQEIRFCTSSDGVRVAYATVGRGPPLVKAANWLSHLEYDWKSPIWRHLARDLGAHYTLVRYDQRGNGLSDWQIGDVSFESFVSDLEAVVDAARLERFALLGISQGSRTAVAYAVRHPERVSHLVIYGGAARGWRHRSPEAAEQRQALSTLMRRGWGSDNPAFRQIFTNLFMPDATAEQAAWFDELQKVSCSGENAARIAEASGEADVTDLLDKVRVPTLVMHATRDAMVSFDEARVLAAGIPDARFVPLDSRNHLLLGDEPAWGRFVTEVREFLSDAGG